MLCSSVRTVSDMEVSPRYSPAIQKRIDSMMRHGRVINISNDRTHCVVGTAAQNYRLVKSDRWPGGVMVQTMNSLLLDHYWAGVNVPRWKRETLLMIAFPHWVP